MDTRVSAMRRRGNGFAGVALAGTLMFSACSAATDSAESPTPTPSRSGNADASPADEWATCDGEGYSISHPSQWFVHPGDESGAKPCALFAADPFSGDPEPDWGWEGAQVVIGTGTGCRGSFENSIGSEEVELDGYTAMRSELQPGEGDPTLRAIEYFLTFGEQVPCESSLWLYSRTESDDPGAFDENTVILDRMMDSIRFESAS
jgi:hypothetical protein